MAVGATAVWRVRPSGSNTNGGGYDPGISGAATDYSQQNAAQATGTHGTATGTTTFTDTVAANFTSAMVGNAIWIASGAGFTVGAYFVTAFTSSTQVTLDSSPGTGTVAVWALGGGWADFTNLVSGSSPAIARNIVYFLGSGTPNPASYVYDYTLTSGITLTSGSGGDVLVLANDPATPGYKAPPDTTGGMPVVRFNGTAAAWLTGDQVDYQGLWFVANTVAGGNLMVTDAATRSGMMGCVLDQFGSDCTCMLGLAALGCAFFSSVAPGSAGVQVAIDHRLAVVGCNIHNTVGIGIYSRGAVLANSIVAKCGGDGVQVASPNAVLINNTIDGNAGNGVVATGTTFNEQQMIINNIISNHTGVGKFGLYTGLTATARLPLVDYNVFYNNTTDINNSTPYSPHDSHGGSNPYVGQSTENYTLA